MSHKNTACCERHIRGGDTTHSNQPQHTTAQPLVLSPGYWLVGCQRTYVVLMPMCYDDRLDLVLPLVQECDIRQDLLHAQICDAADRQKDSSTAPHSTVCGCVPTVQPMYHGCQNMCVRPTISTLPAATAVALAVGMLVAAPTGLGWQQQACRTNPPCSAHFAPLHRPMRSLSTQQACPTNPTSALSGPRLLLPSVKANALTRGTAGLHQS